MGTPPYKGIVNKKNKFVNNVDKMITKDYCIYVIKMITKRKGEKMANPEKLNRYLIESGKKKYYLAQKILVSRPRLDSILKHPDTATVGQADLICSELAINEEDKREIFLPS